MKWGNVREVVIPLKMDKYGNRFGFVRFFNVQNFIILERQLDAIWLDAIWIGERRLKVNLPRFERGDNGGERKG